VTSGMQGVQISAQQTAQMSRKFYRWKKKLCVLGSRPWPYRVTWRRRSRDNSIHHRPFPIGGRLEPSIYLLRFLRYSVTNVTQWLTW